MGGVSEPDVRTDQTRLVITDEIYTRLAEALAPDYELGREIGRGGMGLVFQAKDTRLHRNVAIKLLPPDLAANGELRDRFAFEAQLAAGLNHPHIVPIFDVAEREGLVWYVMALVEGESLRTRVQRDGPLTSSQTSHIVREVAWALAYAHARGIVHRDIKPDNILVDRSTGRALVTDFGIAKMAQRDGAMGSDETGRVLGSLMYMAPEQATGSGDVDGRADIYGLGLTAFYVLAGHDPFEKASILTVAARIATGLTPDWDSIQPEIDPPLKALLEKCVEPEPDDRWDDAEQILDALGPRAIAARPMPASIRRLVRDFLLVPTLGLMVLIIGALSEDAGLGEFIAWLAMLLAVNFGVTLRAFTRRGFRWPDLRDGLEAELRRQTEELEVTGDLKTRFKAVVYIATILGFAVGATEVALHFNWPVSLLVVASIPAALPIAWFQYRVLMFFGRLGRKLIPSLPRPEGAGWFSRIADAVLTRLFKPVRIGKSELGRMPQLTAESTGWRHTDLGSARRSTHDIDDLYATLPRSLRDEVRPARRVARQLTAHIERLRRQRAELERTREQEIESVGAATRQAGVVLERLRLAIEDLADGRIDEKRFRAALAHGRAVAGGEDAGEAASPRPRSSRPWLGVGLGTAVQGRARIDGAPTGIHELGNEIVEGLRHSRERGDRLDGVDEITGFVTEVRRLEAEILLANQRGAHLDSDVADSLTESEMVLEDLLDALDACQSDGGTQQLDELVHRVREVRGRVDRILSDL